MSAARTAWIRKGVKNATDKLLKTFSEDDKNELAIKIRDFQALGE
jgi:hypothetical protein